MDVISELSPQIESYTSSKIFYKKTSLYWSIVLHLGGVSQRVKCDLKSCLKLRPARYRTRNLIGRLDPVRGVCA